MDVVGRSSNANNLTSRGVHQLTYVGMNTFNVFYVYLRASRLNVKNHMKVYLTKRLCHDYSAFALSGRLLLTVSPIPRAMPWAVC